MNFNSQNLSRIHSSPSSSSFSLQIEQPIPLRSFSMVAEFLQQQTNSQQQLQQPNKETKVPVKNERESLHSRDHHRSSTPLKAVGNYSFQQSLGKGSMGKVKLGVHNVTGEKVAVKIVPRANFQQFSQPSHLAGKTIQQLAKEKAREENREIRTIREAHIMMLLKHPNIVGLKDLVLQGPYFYILMDYVNGSQLLHYIVKRQRLSENRTRVFSRQIVSALDYLHRNSMAHRDLKIENIMVDKSGRNIKIIDFGLSNLFCPESQLTTFCGSLYFAAPELLKASPYNGPEVDIWSLGVVIFVMATGSVPFDDKSMPGLHDKIKKGQVNYPSHLSPECIDLLSRIFVVDPSRRIVMTDIVNHPWLNKDSPPINNHMPIRKPLSLPLDPNIIERMSQGFNLGSAEEIQKRLMLIIQSPVYEDAVKHIYDTRSSATPAKSIFYDDPQSVPAAYHALTSLYYLAAEKQSQIDTESHHRRLTIRASISKKASVESLGGYSSARSSQASLVEDNENADPSSNNGKRPLADVPIGQTPVIASANNNSGIRLNGDGSLLGFASAANNSTNYLSRIQRWLRSSLSQHNLSSDNSSNNNVSTPPSPPQQMDDSKHTEVESLNVSPTKENRLPTPTQSVEDRVAPPQNDEFYNSSSNRTGDSSSNHSHATIPSTTPPTSTTTATSSSSSKSLFRKFSQAFFRKGSSKSLHKKSSNISNANTVNSDTMREELSEVEPIQMYSSSPTSTTATVVGQFRTNVDDIPPPVPPKDPHYMNSSGPMPTTPIHDARKSQQQLPPGMSIATVTSRKTAHTVDITTLNKTLYQSSSFENNQQQSISPLEQSKVGMLQQQDVKGNEGGYYIPPNTIIPAVTPVPSLSSHRRRGSVSKLTGKLGSWLNNRSRSNSISHQSTQSDKDIM